MGLFDLVDVGLCQWWMWVWDVGLFGLVSLVVCVCVCVFFFFLGGVVGCRFVPVVDVWWWRGFVLVMDVGLCR